LEGKIPPLFLKNLKRKAMTSAITMYYYLRVQYTVIRGEEQGLFHLRFLVLGSWFLVLRS